jgi:hypothetical protein
MDLGIHLLEIATGLKDALVNEGFTIESILKVGPAEVASVLGIDLYVANIIFNAAKNASVNAVSDGVSIITHYDYPIRVKDN